MNIVSPCCHREVVASTEMEYPLGGRTYGIAYKVDRCEGCGKEVEDYAYACEECGEVGCEHEISPYPCY